MKLKIFQPRLKNNVKSFIRRINRNLSGIVVEKADKVSSLIVLGDGNEDAKVVSLLCYHLDGDSKGKKEKVIDLIKPDMKHYDAIKELKERNYIKNYENIVLVFDQEDSSLEKLHAEVKNTLNDAGIGFEESGSSLRRVTFYTCSLGGHEFKLIVVINGLDDVGGPSHKIEDHLVKLAGVAGPMDSKYIWNGLE